MVVVSHKVFKVAGYLTMSNIFGYGVRNAYLYTVSASVRNCQHSL